MVELPTVETERLLLRKIKRSDLTQVFRGLSDPEVTRYYGVHYETIDAAKEQMRWYRRLHRKDFGRVWALALKAEKETLQGVIAIYNWNKRNQSAEIGFWIMPPFQQQGIVSEALHALIPVAFSHMHLHRLFATTEPENIASIRTLQSTGFSYEGHQRQIEKKGDGWIDLLMYALLENDLEE
jgi:[ribosomal protein S5]-alanine N-acetyltransferase